MCAFASQCRREVRRPRLRRCAQFTTASASQRLAASIAEEATRPYALPAWCCGRPGRNDAAQHLQAEPKTAGDAVVLEPGLVVLREAMPRLAQKQLAADAWETGCGRYHAQHSFFELDGSLRGPKGTRGRIFDACSQFHPKLTEALLPACTDWVRQARSMDSAMPSHEATHLLLLYYKDAGTLGFHRDEQANDGAGDEPVVNLSIGGEIDFAFRHEYGDEARVVTLRSGDVILFGGPCRKILHAVVATRGERGGDVMPPAAGCGRLSFTLRHATDVLGKEHLYRDFRPQTSDPMRKPTGDEELLGREEAVRRLRRMKT